MHSTDPFQLSPAFNWSLPFRKRYIHWLLRAMRVGNISLQAIFFVFLFNIFFAILLFWNIIRSKYFPTQSFSTSSPDCLFLRLQESKQHHHLLTLTTLKDFLAIITQENEQKRTRLYIYYRVSWNSDQFLAYDVIQNTWASTSFPLSSCSTVGSLLEIRITSSSPFPFTFPSSLLPSVCFFLSSFNRLPRLLTAHHFWDVALSTLSASSWLLVKQPILAGPDTQWMTHLLNLLKFRY